jgi:hypothetical protein
VRFPYELVVEIPTAPLFATLNKVVDDAVDVDPIAKRL